MIGRRLWRINIRLGSKSVDTAKNQRVEEIDGLIEIEKWLEKHLKSITRRESKPYVIVHLSEGATSLSIAKEWLPKINNKVREYDGLIIYLLNIGKNWAKLLPDEKRAEEERKKRKNIIMEMIKESYHPPIILTTNCFRIGNDLICENNRFDEYYLEVVYLIDQCAVGEPIGNDLSNLLQPENVYTISTPFKGINYADFDQSRDRLSFMFSGTLGGNQAAPLVSEVKNRVNGMIIISESRDKLNNVTNSFMEWSSAELQIVAYTKREQQNSLISRILGSSRTNHSWNVPFVASFVASITPEEVDEALEKSVEIFKREPEKKEK